MRSSKKIKILNKSYFELFLFICGGIALISLPLLLKGLNYGFDFSGNPFSSEVSTRLEYGFWDLILTIGAIIGIVGALQLSTRNKYSWIFMLIEALLYGANSFFALQSYALGAVNMFIIPVILVCTHFFSWKKETNDGSINTNKLNIKTGLLVVLGILILAGGLGSMFIYGFKTNNSWIGWMDAILASIGVFGFILAAFRLRENYYLWFLSNFVKIIVWTTAIFIIDNGNIIYPNTLLISIIYFLNSIYGLSIWRKSKVVDFKKITS